MIHQVNIKAFVEKAEEVMKSVLEVALSKVRGHQVMSIANNRTLSCVFFFWFLISLFRSWNCTQVGFSAAGFTRGSVLE